MHVAGIEAAILQAVIVAAPIDERIADVAVARGDDAADDDGVRVPLDDFLDLAIEGGQRIAKQRCARDHRMPAVRSVAGLAVCAATEPGRDILVMVRENIDAEASTSLDRGIRRRIAVERHDETRRIDRKAGDGRRRKAGAMRRPADGDDADAAGKLAHRPPVAEFLVELQRHACHRRSPCPARPPPGSQARVARHAKKGFQLSIFIASDCPPASVHSGTKFKQTIGLPAACNALQKKIVPRAPLRWCGGRPSGPARPWPSPHRLGRP